jgi:hypothetical protein
MIQKRKRNQKQKSTYKNGSPRRLADCIMIWSTREARSPCPADDPGTTGPPAGLLAAATVVTETVDVVGVVEDDEDDMAEAGTAKLSTETSCAHNRFTGDAIAAL